MKNLSIFVGVCLLAASATPCLLQASGNGIQPETASGLDPSRPDRPSRDVPQTTTEYAIAALRRAPDTTAGATMDTKDTKSLVAPSVAPEQEDGFSAPAAYTEFKFTQIQDDRPVGFDGPQYNGIVGFDFTSFWNTIVGFNFTYSNENLDTSSAGGNFTNSNNAYFFSTYVAKNFDDWLNLGMSFTYGRTDTIFGATFPGFGTTQKTTQDSYAYAPFLGVAHTWGAFSFSSTPTYIYDYDHFNFDFPVNDPGFAAAGIPDTRTLNQTFLWLNNFQYAINDKWSASIQANWTHLLSVQQVPTFITPFIPTSNRNWVSFGARVDYTFNKDGTVFAAYEHDVFDTHFDDYRIRTGLSYNF